MIYTPENSLIQLLPVSDTYGEIDYCIDELQDCLPAYRGDDIRFQIIFDGFSAPFADYVLKVVDSEDDVVELLPPANAPSEIFGEIDFSEHEGFAVGTFAQPHLNDLLFADFMAVGECFRLCLFKITNVYTYTGPFATYPNETEIELTVNGSTIFSDPFTANSGQDIADLIEELADALPGSDTVEYNAEENTITIYSDTNEYETLIVIAASSEEFNPVVTQGYTKTHCSNCFEVIDDPCFTSVVKYRGNEDSFGFYYEDSPYETNFYNAARLRLYYDNPQPIDDENYFVLSDGTKKVLSARYEKEYEAHTEYFDEARHFQLKAATKHDKFMIGDTFAEAVEYTCEGKYDIGWLNKPGTNIDSAPANFKIRPSPYSQFNSNCE